MALAMTSVDLLKKLAESSFAEFKTAIDSVTEHQSWALLPNNGDDYLHSDATIHGITLHVAVGKFIYGSVGFRDAEIRWRDCAKRLRSFEPSWQAAVSYLEEAHAYWMASWEGLQDSDLEREVMHFRGRLEPVWKIIQTVTHHDAYHAGQIAMLRYAMQPSDVKPPSQAEDIETNCRELPNW